MLQPSPAPSLDLKDRDDGDRCGCNGHPGQSCVETASSYLQPRYATTSELRQQVQEQQHQAAAVAAGAAGAAAAAAAAAATAGAAAAAAGAAAGRQQQGHAAATKVVVVGRARDVGIYETF